MQRLIVFIAVVLLAGAGCRATDATPLDPAPTGAPTVAAATAATAVPTIAPTIAPTDVPVAAPTAVPAPAVQPTASAVPPAVAADVGADSAESAQQPVDCLICDVDRAAYAGPLTAREIDGLLLALNDEYHAIAVYQQVLDDFGTVRPFSNIIRAERQHVALLRPLFDTYGVTVPDNPWLGAIPSFAAVHDACVAGVDAEIVNGALYNELFASTDRDDILSVYQSLQAASINAHLPAFQRCASR